MHELHMGPDESFKLKGSESEDGDPVFEWLTVSEWDIVEHFCSAICPVPWCWSRDAVCGVGVELSLLLWGEGQQFAFVSEVSSVHVQVSPFVVQGLLAVVVILLFFAREAVRVGGLGGVGLLALDHGFSGIGVVDTWKRGGWGGVNYILRDKGVIKKVFTFWLRGGQQQIPVHVTVWFFTV